MADAAMTVLLETLSHMLLSCSDLIAGAEDDLRRLRNEVESFRAILRDTASKPKEEEPFREMERQIEEVFYDAQDTIDSYMVEAAAAQSKIGGFRRRRRRVLVTELASSLAEEVRSLREDEVKPLLDKARVDFPNVLFGHGSETILEQPHPIIIAEEMTITVATVLLEKISNLLMMGDLISCDEEELRLLKNEVESLSVFLHNAGNEQEHSREMERQIKEVFHTMDSYLRRAAAARSKVDLFRRRKDLAEVVRSLREDEVKPMLEKARIEFARILLMGEVKPRMKGEVVKPGMGKFSEMFHGEGFETILEQPHQIKLNEAWSIGANRMVGFEDDQETIVDYLLKPSDELDVISIIGMAGLGKTTLARQIYESLVIQYEFPTRIWVTVSENSNRKDVFLNILKEVSSKDMSSMGDHELASIVHHFLEKRKFLLVLDDVWSEDDFHEIFDALPHKNHSGKVLLTSRAWNFGPSQRHFMKRLTEDKCWELLQLQVFGGLHICPPRLVHIGKRISRTCNRLALTIVIVGGILVDQISKKQSISALKRAWIELSDYMSTCSMETIPMLELSYRRLPDELRILFLYLGVFPEDYEISTTTLTRLWIAEGLIQHQDGRRLEDIAEENLNKLVQRKLVIVDKVRSIGKVKSCHLHDIVRDFCVREGHKANLFRELRGYKKLTLCHQIDDIVQEKHRRLCVCFDPLDFFSSKPYVSSVRSFSLFQKTESLLLPENTSKIPGDAFELVRVLDIKPVRFTRFPLELTQLYCLRYIVLSSTFKILPEVISMLRNIQTLVIHTSSRTLEIKADIWKMIQLRHLQTNASITLRNEPEDHSHQELQTLANLSPENCTVSVFNRASCLKKLGIRGTLPILLDGEIGSRKFDHFEKLKNLENLTLINDVHMISPSECLLSCLPPTEKFPPKLRSLTLSATFLSWEHMSILGKLEKLEVLKLKDNAFVGECWEVLDGSFSSLQVLQIGYTNLVSWKVASGHFPKLRSLALRNCEKLDALPQGLGTVQSLQEIELLRPSKTIVASARKIEKDRLQMKEKYYSRIKLSIFFPPDE